MNDPRAREDDLTSKARIRNAALDLYAAHGEDRVSMRAVAAHADVTVGLVQHHFKTKEGLRAAVDQLIVDYYVLAIASAPTDGTAQQIAGAKDEAVREMLAAHPTVVNYIRRAVLDPNGGGELLRRLTDLSRGEVAKARSAGRTTSRRSESSQVIGLMVRQLGQLLMQPMIDDMWEHLTQSGDSHGAKPLLYVSAKSAEGSGAAGTPSGSLAPAVT
ncbi:TetR/AcrR family transcriptional regulator [Leucobacter albus]|uniref:TetR/AcrR family transcriptional regulator n=1 Tax=Leucobacter albus TaxID=272210 RepID=A0ABW3TRA3_9MICO